MHGGERSFAVEHASHPPHAHHEKLMASVSAMSPKLTSKTATIPSPPLSRTPHPMPCRSVQYCDQVATVGEGALGSATAEKPPPC